MTDYPRFVEGGQLTTPGQQLQEWVEAQYAPYDKPGADANIAALNSMAGPIQEYWTLVAKMNVLTPAKWMEGHTQSARNAYDLMKWVEAEATKTQQVQETAQQTNDLEAKFAAFQESIAAKVAELEQENTALRTKVAELEAKPAAEVTPEVEAVEPEPAPTGKKAKKTAAEPETADVKPEGETPAESE